MTILVTGGCGFIGTNFIKRFQELNSERVVNIDYLTYAANPNNHKESKLYKLYPLDINAEFVKHVIDTERPKLIVHFAAESHVDNSIKNSSPFIKSNILGTYNLLEYVRSHITWDYKLIHVSTDEVYGSLSSTDPAFTETTAYDPRSPYSASKAASDHLVNAYYHTHGLKVITTNCSNNYGPYQFPEKFIPVVISKALKNDSIPVYGNGLNIRDWLHVEDHCDGILTVIEKGTIGEKYNIGGNCEMANIDLAKMILKIMSKPESLIKYVEDRKGHDFRYAINSSKLQSLGWKPKYSINTGLEKTIQWYIDNQDWLWQKH
jgi:dTDP-glucose 4,6-dehydratase